MERKTWRRSVDGYEDVGLCDGVSVGDAICDLTAFEDTGLEPKEIIGLCAMDKRSRMAKMLRWEEAEKEGRLVVLPCKVGDTVYRIVQDAVPHITKDEVCDIRFSDRMNVYIELVGRWVFYSGRFGETVFLTREQAESALRGEENGND